MAGSPIVHMEFVSKDPVRSAEFFASLFGWEVDTSEPYYPMFTAPSVAGGFLEPQGSLYKDGDVLVYVQADDIESVVARAVSLGAEVVQPKTEIPNTGWYAVLMAPGSTRIGLFQRKAG